MLQRYHLLIRRPGFDRSLADCRAIGWLLPIATGDARTRAPHVVARLLSQVQIDGSIACVTCGRLDPSAAGIDWLAVVDERRPAPSSSLTETTIEALLSQRGIVTVQSSLLRGYRSLSSENRSALSIGWFTETVEWTKRVYPDLDPHPVVHRADLFDQVWEFRTSGSSLFLRRRDDASFLDPHVAAIVGAANHLCVPTTLAHDPDRSRWLTAGVRGVRLTVDLAAMTVGRVADAMAHTQIALIDAVPKLRAIGVGQETLADLAAAADGLFDRIGDDRDARGARSRICPARAAIHRACALLDALSLPPTWIHTDFVPENVFVDGDRVSIIDFDDAWIGPAPVAMEFLFSGVRRYVGDRTARAVLIDAARDRFMIAWAEHVPRERMMRAFTATRLVAEVLRVSRRLRALAMKEASGELVGLLEPAACESARRLVALAQR